MGKGLIPVDLSFSTSEMPDVGDIYISENVSLELDASDFDGLCFVHGASFNAGGVGASHTMLFFGIPWTKIPKQLVKGIALNFIDWKSYLLGPLYGIYKAGKFVLGSGDMPNVLRPLAGEAKGVIIMKGQVVGPAISIGASIQYGYMSSDTNVMPWEWNFPSVQKDIDINYKTVSRDESIIRVPGDILFGFDKDKIGTGEGGLVRAEETLSVVAYVLGLIRPRAVFTEGHTDSVGSPAYNLSLSRRRSAAVKSWLLTKGKLNGLLITPLGFGLTKPVEDNRTEKGREKNRRVEVRFYG